MSEETTLHPCTTVESLRVAEPDLRWCCDPSVFEFETTEDVQPLRGMIGQEDAIEALRFGLETFAPGQHVYVRGLTGTGRSTLVRSVLEGIQPACPLASDYCYVANFERPNEPRLLELPRGRGYAFRDATDELIDFLAKDLAPALASESLRSRRRFLDERFEEEARRISLPFEEELGENDLTMVSVKLGESLRPAILPLIEGEPAPPERLQQLRASGELTDEELEALEKKVDSWGKRLEDVAHRMRDVGLRHGEEVRRLVQGEMRSLVQAETDAIREDFGTEAVGGFLDDLIDEIVKHGVEDLQGSEEGRRRFAVNVILGHDPDEDCPVIIENTPTLGNLLGNVDRRVLAGGVVVSDHLMISAGSLLRADGGYLILEARELLREPGAWKVLIRTLRSGQLEIVPSELGGPWGTRTLKPEPIPVQIKVILIGDPGLYYILDAGDPDFPHLFKVLADFDSSIPCTDEGLRAYAGLFARIAIDEGLPHFDRTAVAALAEHGARVAGRHDRLSTRFGRIVDLAREAAFLTSKSTDSLVNADAVREAVRRTKRRGDLPARKFRERIVEGTVHVSTTGTAVGQVNGLAVIHAGPLTYGFPTRITSTIGAGHAGAINIERESQLSGSIHTKGFYILGGLLRHLLQTPHPLAFSASIAFEQSYGGIDGDSASGAEICCLMSSLTGIPLRQDLAMTGAIDQHGRILPIGAATEKIEGFYDACRDIGPLETQGVVLPRSNVGDLMLREDIVAECAAGRFHVYAVDTIQEALGVFTGIEVGERGEDGEYPEGTLLRAAVDRAFDLWALASARPMFEEETASEEEPEEHEEV
jgi:ATP-dependent Lon protease